MPHAMPSLHQDTDSQVHADMNLAHVVARLAAEVSGPLTQALGRVAQLAASGSIDRQGLMHLRSEIDDARRAGLLGQRIARFLDDRALAGLEHVELGAVLRSVLNDQVLHAAAGSPGHHQSLVPCHVLADASLVHTVMSSAVAWAQANAKGQIDWQLDADPWQPIARLRCSFPIEAAALPSEPGHDAGLDSLDWLLLRYSAHVADVSVARGLADHHVTLTLRFKHTVDPEIGNTQVVELDSGPSTRALLTGCQVLVLAASRDTRRQVRQALKGHDVFIDCVHSVASAEAYCDDGLPQVLIHESCFDGEALHSLRERLTQLSPPVTVIELLPRGHACELASSHVRLGAESLSHSLAPVLTMALAKNL